MTETLTETTFDQLQTMAASGAPALFGTLVEQLTQQGRYHELFDARLMQARYELGLPVIMAGSVEEMAEPLRTQVEEAYLKACREVGLLLAAQGKVREAWLYLRPLGDNGLAAKALESIEPSDEHVEELIEVLLNEGVDPLRGFELVLKNYGTCNSITMFENEMSRRGKPQQQAAAALLLRHLHGELVDSLQRDISKQSGASARAGIARQSDGDSRFNCRSRLAIPRQQLSHRYLASGGYFALRTARGRHGRAAPGDRSDRIWPPAERQYQFAGEEPFADFYPSHGLFFRAQLTDDTSPEHTATVAEAVNFFRNKAETLDAYDHGTAPTETLVILLSRLGRHGEAIDALTSLLPEGARPSPQSPTLWELARRSGDFGRLMTISRQRGDLLGFTAGLLESQASSQLGQSQSAH